MKILGILFSLFLLTFPFQAYAQSLSELEKQLDEANLEKAKEIASGQQPQSSFQDVDCLPWQIKKAVSGGGIICVDDPNFQGLSSDDNAGYIAIGVIIVIIIIAVIVKANRKSEPESLPRKGWTDSQHKEIIARQGGVCANRGEYAGSFQFDHIDGNSNNNDINNAQGLCPNCHDRKSRGLN